METSKSQTEASLGSQLSGLQQRLDQLAADKESSESRLNAALEQLQRSLLSKPVWALVDLVEIRTTDI